MVDICVIRLKNSGYIFKVCTFPENQQKWPQLKPEPFTEEREDGHTIARSCSLSRCLSSFDRTARINEKPHSIPIPARVPRIVRRAALASAFVVYCEPNVILPPPCMLIAS